MPRPGREGLCLWSAYVWSRVFQSGSPTEKETMLGWTSSREELPHPPASSPCPCLLTTSRPPRWPDFTHHFYPNFHFDKVSSGASHLLNGLWPWHPGSWVLILAGPLIYHSLKLSYLLSYLLSASSLWNARSVRTGTLPLLYPWLLEWSLAQGRCSGNVC